MVVNKSSPAERNFDKIDYLFIIGKMVRQIMFFIFYTLFGVAKTAEFSPPYCDDFYSTVCAEKTQKLPKAHVAKVDQLIDQKKGEIVNQFQRLLADPDQKYFRKLSIYGLGMQKVFDCSKANGQKTIKECNDKLSEKLFDLLVADAAGTHSSKKNTLGSDALMKDTELLLANGHFSEISKKLADDIFPKLQNVDHVAKIETELFPKAKKQLLLQIQNLAIPDEKKEEWMDKIKSIRFGGTDCSALKGKEKSRLAQAFTENAYYMLNENNFYFCPGLSAQMPGDALTTLIITHELSHAIGPCSEFYYKVGAPISPTAQYPLKNLVACLRSEKSVHAQYNFENDNFVMAAFKKPFLKAGLIDRKNCDEDQVDEAVPDWLATETVASLLVEKYKNTDRITAIKEMTAGWDFICPVPAEANGKAGVGAASTKPIFNSHPRLRARINKIFLQNPKIRFLLGCPQSKTSGYCDAVSDLPVNSVFGLIKGPINKEEPVTKAGAAK